MKSIVDAKEFAQALNRVNSVLRKSAIPMLESVLVCFCGGSCILTATDMKVWAKTELPASGDDFEFLLMKPVEMLKACRYYDGELAIELTIPNDEGYRTIRTLNDHKGGYNRYVTHRELETWSYQELLNTLSAVRKDTVGYGWAA